VKEISVLEEDEDEDELLFLVLIFNKLLFSTMLSFSLCLFLASIEKIVNILFYNWKFSSYTIS
jgi:hypothetical protein